MILQIENVTINEVNAISTIYEFSYPFRPPINLVKGSDKHIIKTTAGRVITMFSSLFGIAVIALPAGIITAGYMDKLHEKEEVKKLRPDNSEVEIKEE